MIEIDSGIIDAGLLFERVKLMAASKEISEEFYINTAVSSASFAGFDQIHREMLSVYQNLQMMNATWIITEKELHSSKPVIGRFIVLGKRIFRKLTRWLFRSYYEQQTDFNGAATRTISDMIRVQELLIQSCKAAEEGGKADAD